MKNLSNNLEGQVIRFGVVVFWLLFWLLNSIDKFIGQPIFLWIGKDRLVQIKEYFSTIGIDGALIPTGVFVFTTILEIAAFLFLAAAFLALIHKQLGRARALFFWGTFAGLAIFSFFTIGDQVFGDREELLEHTVYWVSLIVSWGAYNYFPKK